LQNLKNADENKAEDIRKLNRQIKKIKETLAEQKEKGKEEMLIEILHTEVKNIIKQGRALGCDIAELREKIKRHNIEDLSGLESRLMKGKLDELVKSVTELYRVFRPDLRLEDLRNVR
jgi:DNA-binding NtrC family response regulator